MNDDAARQRSKKIDRSVSLIDGFCASRRAWPGRPALDVSDRVYTYRELGGLADRIAATILRDEPEPRPLAAVFALRSLTAYAGVLGVLSAGKGYVPLHPRFPIDRTRRMLAMSGANVIVADDNALPLLPDLLADVETPMTVICPEPLDVCAIAAALPGHHVVGVDGLEVASDAFAPVPTSPDGTAYLLFTSGSTGVPKGVAISHDNVVAYVRHIATRYGVGPEDRFSQTFDLTFDLSVHDMFVCWQGGGRLCVVPESSVMAPGKFIKAKKLTMWFSVPSVAMFMSRFGMLKPGAYPTLRYSLFCGEPLSGTIASAWQSAAPDSVVENLYGPTEATIAISHYRWDPATSPDECVNGVVPIGWIFSGQTGRAIDADRRPVPDGEPGELCLSGSQVTKGYLNDPAKTREQFIRLEDRPDETYYRTGDLVRMDDRKCLFYLGRIDEQVQIRGYRVELQEVDAALRSASGSDLAVAVAWPIVDGRAEGVYGFLLDDRRDAEARILERCTERLPDYMVPRQLLFVDEIPQNANGKIDRKALAGRVEELLNE